MKTVLIVDDEKLFLASLTEGLSSHSDEFQVVTANNGKQAIGIIDSSSIDLVVTDLKMPVMDGFQLLAHLMSENLNFPIIVMTAFGTPEIENRLKEFEAFEYLEKPIDFQKLADKIREALTRIDSGRLNGVSLFSFLQLVQMEQKTCFLKIKSGERAGTLVFSKGELYDAAYETLKGEKAAMEVVCWENAEIEIVNILKKIKRKIQKPLTNLLMDAAQAKDEAALAAESNESVPRLEIPGDSLEKETSPDELDLLSNSNGAGTTAQRDSSAADNTQAPAKKNAGLSNPEVAVAETDALNSNSNSIYQEINLTMANNVTESINELMAIDGAMAVALVDSTSGMALGTAGGGVNLDVAAAGNSEVIKAKLKTMSNLGLKDTIEDILISLGTQLHLIRPLKEHKNLFFYLVLNKTTSNMAMARFKLTDIESRVQV